MIMSPRTWIAAVAVIAAAHVTTRVCRRQERGARGDVRRGRQARRASTSAAQQTPTFTVYKLERPSRVVIDMPQARLAEALRGHESAATFTRRTPGRSRRSPRSSSTTARVRVIVTLARPGRYDVKTDGNEVVVMVMPRDPAPKMANPAELEAGEAGSRDGEGRGRSAAQGGRGAAGQARSSRSARRRPRVQPMPTGRSRKRRARRPMRRSSRRWRRRRRPWRRRRMTRRGLATRRHARRRMRSSS